MKKIIVLAGGNDQIYLIKELRLRFPGAEILLVDYLETPVASHLANRHIRISTLDREAVLLLAKLEQVDLVITVSTDQALTVMAYVSEQLNLPCYLTYGQAVAVTNKENMKKRFGELRIPTAACQIIAAEDSAESLSISYPLLIKPVDSNSSKGVVKVMGPEEYPDAFAHALQHSRSGKLIAEEFVNGSEYSVDAFILDGIPHILLITKTMKYRQNENRFTIIQSLYPTPELAFDVTEAILGILDQLSRGFGLVNSPILLQLLIDGENIHVIEFSARTGGGSKLDLIHRLNGLIVAKHILDITLGRQITLAFLPSPIFAAMNFLYMRPGVFREVKGLDTLQRDGVIDQYYLYKSPGSVISSTETSSDRPAGFLCTAKSREELVEKIFYTDTHLEVPDANGCDAMIHGIYEL